ncbi:hypothetical protein GZ78_12290 [Endozoicomonas numazuensis]|uniref:Uncharacterized protein n=1 Tax=Endozoicomonas numazuensis TaxID=1137799 RepID=A0A081NIM0_9GAMM|nr:hypothetical protein GZ78_12290 [Endozoicomonas numazuensis]
MKLSGVFSYTLNEAEQKDKIMALEMNHDLRRPVRFKKWLRKRLQKALINLTMGRMSFLGSQLELMKYSFISFYTRCYLNI